MADSSDSETSDAPAPIRHGAEQHPQTDGHEDERPQVPQAGVDQVQGVKEQQRARGDQQHAGEGRAALPGVDEMLDAGAEQDHGPEPQDAPALDEIEVVEQERQADDQQH